jgi:hypothetical protein
MENADKSLDIRLVCATARPAELQNSLFPAKYSLFLEIFSLLICVGNYAKTACTAAVYRSEVGP